MSEFEVVWSGDVRGPDRGQLMVPAHPARRSTDAAPILGDWHAREESSALSARIKALTNLARPMLQVNSLSSRQLRDRLGCSMKDTQVVLMRLRREGRLQVQLLTRAEQRLRGLKQTSQIYRVRVA